MSSAEQTTPPAAAGGGCPRARRADRADRSRHGVRRSSRQVAGIAATIAAGVAVTSGGVYAALTAEAFNATPQTAASGTLLLTLGSTAGSAGFGTPIPALAPGDVVNRYVQLQNTGTLAGQGLTLGLADSTASLLTTDAVRGLQVTVTECSTAWTAATGTCPGTSAPALPSTPAATLVAKAAATTPAPLAAAGSALAPGALRHYQVSATLPTSTEVSTNGTPPPNSVQGLTANLTWRFALTQRDAVTTNG